MILETLAIFAAVIYAMSVVLVPSMMALNDSLRGEWLHNRMRLIVWTLCPVANTAFAYMLVHSRIEDVRRDRG